MSDLEFNPITGKFDLVKDVPLEIGKISLDPTGYPNRTDSQISFVDGTRTFTIEPVVTSFEFYSLGKRFKKTSAQTTVIDDTEGLWFIYFDTDGVLQSSQTPWAFDSGIVFTALLYWDATNDTCIFLGEERHGLSMDWSTHQYLHDLNGARWETGLTPSVTIGTGSSDADAELQSISSGTIFDEDIEQNHSLQSSFEIWYKDGASGDWRKTSSGPAIVDVTAGRPNWNEFTGGAWQKTEISNNNFMLMHLFSTNRTSDPNILIMGENEYLTQGQAQDAAPTEISDLITAGLPTVEFVEIASFLIQCRDAYTNIYNTRVIQTSDGGDFIDHRESVRTGVGGSTNHHGNLTGLSEDDHTQYHNDTRADTWFTGKDLADLGTKSHTSLTDIGSNTHTQIDNHISSTSNPHSVTTSQVLSPKNITGADLSDSDGDNNRTYTSSEPSQIFADGIYLHLTRDYTFSGSTITFLNSIYDTMSIAIIT